MQRSMAGFALVVGLAGCAGVDFKRPSEADFVVGQARYSDVIEKMGKPQFTGETMVNDKKVKRIAYSYAASGGEPLESGVIPARANAFLFDADLLVGTEFTSSFKDDHTRFDDTKVQYIKKGETTRDQVLLALGRPSALYLPPVVKKTNGLAFGYLYQTTSGNVYTGLKFAKKYLLVTFDASDKVEELDYNTSSTN